ncbi:DNA alkylation repair protein [Williamsia soli]|uniref:DNA alkylation repair protein n=1 Tax=Williamsia soli TaxID=364929 RepID=UPI001A9DD51C|nr:DNA alkylation repair protein [Williamsia soli]
MPFADELLGAPAVKALAGCLTVAGQRSTATKRSAKAFDGMALKERSDLVCDALLEDLPDDYVDFVAAVNALVAQPECSGWMVWPITEAVASRASTAGSARAFDTGLVLLKKLTPRLTAEFALRTMLIADVDRTLAAAKRWTTARDEHVRRLASEGTRHYLPWARRVPQLLTRPDATLPIIDALYRDPSDYVRRSVANHLNDLSRQHPELVVDTATRWLAAPDANTDRLVRHALRTLIKRGDANALALLGFAAPASISLVGLNVDPTVSVGGTLGISATLINSGDEPVRVIVDYSVGFRKANGTVAHKVFKLAAKTVGPGERVDIAKTHSFAPITTRRYYPGGHELAIQVNGLRMGLAEFELLG